jgi:RNA polymerase sigma-70 factor (ECF subfamily)
MASRELHDYRPLLLLQARQLRLPAGLQARFDASDLVQEALLRAHKGLRAFDGRSEAQLVRWLQEILANVVVDFIRYETRDKRDFRVERQLRLAIADSSACLERWVADRAPTPQAQAEQHEKLLQLARELEKLPGDQREVIILREMHGMSVAQIAEQVGRTEKSVAGLLRRGKGRLRELLAPTPVT